MTWRVLRGEPFVMLGNAGNDGLEGPSYLGTKIMIAKVVKIGKLTDKNSDYDYWKEQHPVKRIETLETIRREYNNWRYSDVERRFQRVYRIVKLGAG